ncbi:aminodeoxychorismate lyase [Salinimonas lutimaris]|uniref:aminodeoxychorismate lyase n=1 Tax=Salinimonas lutimaris TaxID=914153 RepID=UPI0015866247|nr:aminodeoxychorismate lyase [Salinimonas lutimaris]
MSEFSLNDRVANYGDGLFTTMTVSHGRVALFERHRKRLLHDAQQLGISLDNDVLVDAIRQHAVSMEQGTLKLLISAGEGGRGYARGNGQPSLHFSVHALPAHYAQWREQGIRVGVSPVSLARQPLLAGLKHANRLEQVLIKQQMATQHVDDVLVTDTAGNMIEASAANVFWCEKGRWVTPDVSQCGVAGVMRSFVTERLAAQQCPVSVTEQPMPAAQHIEAMFFTNALMQIVPVRDLHADTQVGLRMEPVKQIAQQLRADYEQEYDTY